MLWSSAGLAGVGQSPKGRADRQQSGSRGVCAVLCTAHPVPLRAALPLLAFALVSLAGCDSQCERSGLNCGAGVDADPPVVAGVNVDSLFAPPTGQEIAAVRAEWARAPDSSASLRLVATLDLGDRETVRVVEGVAPGVEGPLFVGAIRQPPREVGDARSRPLLLVLGDDTDASVPDLVRDLGIRETLKDEVVMVFLAYRGGTLHVGDQAYSSSAPADIYDGDADDALALITHLDDVGILAGVDRSRLAVVGHGRGGNVALLMAMRAKARERGVPQYVLSLAAPTSFFTPRVQSLARFYLEDRPSGIIPGLQAVFDATAGRVQSGELTIPEARLALLRRSAAPFYGPNRLFTPPFVFAAYAENDVAVPIEEARALDFLTGQPSQALYLELDDANHDTVQRDPDVISAGAHHLCTLVLSDSVSDCR